MHNNRLVQAPRKAALKLVISQAIFVVVITLIVYLGWDLEAAKSAFIGGMNVVIPSLIFALYAFRFVGATAAKMVTGSFYRGQALKLLTTFVLFVISFKYLDVKVEPLMIAFILTLLTHWLAPFYFNQR